MTRPLKPEVKLPLLNLSDYYEVNNQYGYKLKVTPSYSYEKNLPLINQYMENRYDSVAENLINYDEKYDEELQLALEKHLDEENIDFLGNPFTKF